MAGLTRAKKIRKLCQWILQARQVGNQEHVTVFTETLLAMRPTEREVRRAVSLIARMGNVKQAAVPVIQPQVEPVP